MERANAEQMAQWLTWREQHGWSWAETARRCGHPVWKLRWWQRRLERTRTRPRTSNPGFVAVEIAEPTAEAPAALEVTTPSGYRLSIPREFEPEHLRRVLEVLERRC